MPKLHLDAEVRFDDLTFDLMVSEIKLSEPNGHGKQIQHRCSYADAEQVQEPELSGGTQPQALS